MRPGICTSIICGAVLLLSVQASGQNLQADDPELRGAKAPSRFECAFETHDVVLRNLKDAIARGFDGRLVPRQRVFLYLPYQHSERLDHQRRSVELVTRLNGEPDWLKYAERHLEIIARFGRFPHRNAVLGRETTPEEAEFLGQPNSAF